MFYYFTLISGMKPLLSCMALIIILTFSILVSNIQAISKPTAIVPDPSYTTGTMQVINNNWGSTSPSNFLVNYQTTMATSSLNATIGIMGVHYYIKNNQWGWRLSIASVGQSSLNLMANVKSSSNPISYLRICYLVTSNSLLDINWVSYSFSTTSDPIANYALGVGNCFIDCRSYSKSQSFRSKTAGRVLTFLSGFDVNSNAISSNSTTFFGITLEPSQPPGGTVSTFSMNITVYGGAELTFVSYFYISYEPKTINIINYRWETDGVNAAMGCYYSINTCNPIPPVQVSPGSNTWFKTGQTAVMSYSQNNFFIGISRMIMSWAGDTSTTGEFNLTNIAQNSDSSISVSFSFTGNSNSEFQVAYSYFTLQTFYCPTVGLDRYAVYNSNTCDSHCNGTIQQYANATNFCQLCGTFCWTCVTGPNFCTSCYNNQSRVLSSNLCVCDTSAGVYDDGSSVVCPMCHYSCKTCSGGTISSCLTCDSANHRTILGNSCPCDNGYFDNGASSCVSCHYTCATATCSSTANVGCSSCNIVKQRTHLANFTCGCTAGYYDNSTSSQQCSLCHYSCYSCWGVNTLCLSCSPTNNRYFNATDNTCNCGAGYYDSGMAMCSLCFVTCYTCSGPLNTNCLSCNISLGRTLVGSTCTCGLRLYDFNNTCLSCSYTCLTCSSFSANSCLTCNSAAFRTIYIANNSCPCNVGYYDAASQVCLSCSSTCLTCTINPTMCTSCHSNPGRYFSGSGYSCLCSSGYVDITFNGFCTLCAYSCQTCSGSLSTNCVLCAANRIQNGTSCVCPDGTYDNGANATCQLCASTCLICSGGLSSQCTSCNSAQYRYLIPTPVGACICSSSYYDAGGTTCQLCSPVCLTCWGSASNCSSCDNIVNHRLITAINTCVCASGYVEVGATACTACLSPCLTCSVLPNNCTSCSADRTLSSGICNCVVGKFQNSSGLCENCAISCATCSGATVSCLTCPLGSNRFFSNYSCPCITGYLETNTTFCQPCSYTCGSCNVYAYVCSSCPVGSFRTVNSSTLTCPCIDGYYDNGGSAACLPCSPLCLTCTLYSQCLTCNASLFRSWSSSTLTCICNTGYFDSGAAICTPCYSTCATCSGISSINCITCQLNRILTSNSCPCIDGMYDAAGICNSCLVLCLTCSVSANNCTSCASGSYLSNNQCVCNIGYYLNGNICSQCDTNCYSCSVTSTSCLACNPTQGTILNGSSCLCPYGTFLNSNSICQGCDIRCLTCSGGSKICLSCSPSSHRSINSSISSCDCDTGYYDNNLAVCQICATPCLTCNGGTVLNCTSCIFGYTLIGSSCVTMSPCPIFIYQGICLTSCPNTTYTSSSSCLPCINNCLRCASATFCYSCKSNYYMYNNTCLLTCPNNTYIITANQSCSLCPSFCTQCAMRNSLICYSCSTGYYLVNNSCSANCLLDGTHVLMGQICMKCLIPCITCIDLTSSGCTSCSFGYSLYNGMCLGQCPQGFLSINNFCIACGSNCSKCINNLCIKCLTGFYLNQNGKCSMNGYFLDSSGASFKCHPNCLSCTDSSFSSCIACNFYRGDSSQMAISGYCDCWVGSIDAGNGTCDYSTYKSIQTFTNILITSTTSTTYLSALAGVISLNFYGCAMTIFYQQTYSNFYYINSSAVLQTDSVLQRYGDSSISKFSKGNDHKQFGRRLYNNNLSQTYLQDDESLFMRGQPFQYLIKWGKIVAILTVCLWCLILLMKFVKNKLKANGGNAFTVTNKMLQFLNESAIIILLIFTFNEVTLYAIASFKVAFKKYPNSIHYTELIFSILYFGYYMIYLFRLLKCSFKGNVPQNCKKLKVLFAFFENSKLSRKACCMYIPILLLRSLFLSLFIVVFSYNPIVQAVSCVVIILIWDIYSYFSCPYYFYIRVCIRFHELLFTMQIILLAVSITKPQYSRVGVSIGILILNFIQILLFIVLSICIALDKIYHKKCLKREENSIYPNETSDKVKAAHSSQGKLSYVEKPENPIIQQTIEGLNELDQNSGAPNKQNQLKTTFYNNQSYQPYDSMLYQTNMSMPLNDFPISLKRFDDFSKKEIDEQEEVTKKRYRVRRERKI